MATAVCPYCSWTQEADTLDQAYAAGAQHVDRVHVTDKTEEQPTLRDRLKRDPEPVVDLIADHMAPRSHQSYEDGRTAAEQVVRAIWAMGGTITLPERS